MQSRPLEEWVTHFGPFMMTELFCPLVPALCLSQRQTSEYSKLRANRCSFRAEGQIRGLSD
jgi:hypothetical protein